ncbi:MULTISPECIES: hypothetical protein [Kitasatospora]|uniref:Roadblock/LAMTOR2 domain-containing protein n=1 Tax=Kitasatospora setae (strain ATCC 33774 / DSM 43861 / JCM 3304 / KCC A-0304 / NBRC 14216 / KM-6054) TaxID=452652 RepID=E4N2T5_KITSK|nr:hypothetical protein [Kitasatospora setae]BAJ32469.1 hypothetical protein KSE_67110 [Kitasatospora setae KM-6054]
MPGIEECLAEAMGIGGALGVSLVDWTNGLAIGTAGLGPDGDHETGAADATELARAVTQTPSFADPDSGAPPAEDVIVTSGGTYHLLRFVPASFDANVFLYLRLDRNTANLAMARLRLAAIADRLVLS